MLNSIESKKFLTQGNKWGNFSKLIKIYSRENLIPIKFFGLNQIKLNKLKCVLISQLCDYFLHVAIKYIFKIKNYVSTRTPLGLLRKG